MWGQETEKTEVASTQSPSSRYVTTIPLPLTQFYLCMYITTNKHTYGGGAKQKFHNASTGIFQVLGVTGTIF